MKRRSPGVPVKKKGSGSVAKKGESPKKKRKTETTDSLGEPQAGAKFSAAFDKVLQQAKTKTKSGTNQKGPSPATKKQLANKAKAKIQVAAANKKSNKSEAPPRKQQTHQEVDEEEESSEEEEFSNEEAEEGAYWKSVGSHFEEDDSDFAEGDFGEGFSSEDEDEVDEYELSNKHAEKAKQGKKATKENEEEEKEEEDEEEEEGEQENAEEADAEDEENDHTETNDAEDEAKSTHVATESGPLKPQIAAKFALAFGKILEESKEEHKAEVNFVNLSNLQIQLT